MTAITLGPLAVPIEFIPWLAALMALWATVWLRRRDAARPDPEALLTWTLFSMLLGARLAFVMRYWDRFDGPLAMLDVRDGGFWWPGAVAGALAGLGLALWRGHRRALGEAGLAGAAGLIVALLTTMITLPLQPGPVPAPTANLRTLDHRMVPLKTLTGDRVTVVNLWASWCPPCRREMPVFERAQTQYPGVRFVYANQGEGAATVRRYLTEEALRLDRVLLDPHRDLGRAVGGGLPTTLIINADGQWVDRHLGPLSPAALHHLLSPYTSARAAKKE